MVVVGHAVERTCIQPKSRILFRVTASASKLPICLSVAADRWVGTARHDVGVRGRRRRRNDLTDLSTGLTACEARARLEKGGRNAVVDVAQHPLRRAVNKLWAPVPWMLEAAILLQLGLGEYVEAAVIALLLVFNAALGVFPGRPRAGDAGGAEVAAGLDCVGAARRAMDAPCRPPNWSGDIVKLSLGAVVAADMRLIEGRVLLDQSMLTGESLPIEAGPGSETYAGALVRRGEAVGRGHRDRRAHEIRAHRRTRAHRDVESSQQKAVLRRGAQPGDVQWRGDVGWQRMPSALGMPTARNHAAGADRRLGVDPGGAAGDVHAGSRARGTRPGAAGRLADAPLGGG